MNKDSTGVVECSDGTVVTIRHKGNLIDGDSGTPYTGMTGGSGDPDPETPVGGPDGDSGRLHPIFGYGGGSDDSGGTPGDKDGDDDSGKFLQDGTLSGGDGGGFIDPGDLDYYTPTGQEANVQNFRDARG